MRQSVIVLAWVLIGGTQAFAQGRPGVDFSPGLVPIVEGVYAYEGPLHLEGEEEIVRTNSLVIVTDDGVVVVDGQDSPDEGRAMIEAIREVTDEPIRFLVNASPHGDHINSNEVFEGSTIISHEGAREAIAEVRSRVAAAGSGISPPLPHQTYRDRMTLVVGDRTIELHYYGRGHTRGDTVVFLPQVGVAFLSELYFNGVFASVGEGFVREHIETLSQAMMLPAEWWIPGHGYIKGQSKAQLAQGVEDYLANLEAIHAAVGLRVALGQTLEEVLDGIDADLGAFADLPFYHYLKSSAIGGTYRALTESR